MVRKKGIVWSILLVLLVQGCSILGGGEGGEDGETITPRGEWEQHMAMITPRSEMPAAVLDGVIYAPGGFGGEQALEAYDPAADEWQALPELPAGRHHVMAAAHQGKIYVFGGARSLIDWRATDTTWAFDPESQEWAELAPMPEARLAGAAVSLEDYLYVVGGAGSSQALLRYDPAGDAWAQLAPLEQPREHTAAVTLNGKIYALAGRWEGSGELTSVEVYDPETDEWTAAPALNVARGGHAAADERARCSAALLAARRARLP